MTHNEMVSMIAESSGLPPGLVEALTRELAAEILAVTSRQNSISIRHIGTFTGYMRAPFARYFRSGSLFATAPDYPGAVLIEKPERLDVSFRPCIGLRNAIN